MSAQFKEALANLARLHSASAQRNRDSPTLHINRQLLDQWLEPVRSALEAAKQHAEDLQTIAEWKRADVNRDAALHVWDFYFRMLLSGPRGWSMPFDDFDPMKAIHDAAEWIRKEMAK